MFSRRHEYDTVAYLGHVPVKLLGGCAAGQYINHARLRLSYSFYARITDDIYGNAGQYIIPSGRNDGTAIAHRNVCIAPSQVMRASNAMTM